MKGLLESTSVGSVPGSAFFPTMANTGTLRFCFALNDDLLDLACERLSCRDLSVRATLNGKGQPSPSA